MHIHTYISLKQNVIDKVKVGKEMEIVHRMKNYQPLALEYNAGVQWWTKDWNAAMLCSGVKVQALAIQA